MPKTLPLVHLSVLRPLMAGLGEDGIDPLVVLDAVGLTPSAIESDDSSVHVMVVHQFLETCAEVANDITFCARIGARLDPTGWPMLQSALRNAQTVGDFLNTFVAEANTVASSVTSYLNVQGQFATFGETRLFRPNIQPAQNDGFMLSLALSILQRGLGDRLEPRQMVLVVTDPSVLPDGFRIFQVMKGDDMGFRIQFPSAWLRLAIGDSEGTREHSGLLAEPPGRDFLSSLRRVLEQNIGNGGLDSEKAASLVAMSRFQLARRLASLDTKISVEIHRAKLSYIKSHIVDTQVSINDLALSLGYRDPGNFARWFRKLTGLSPTEFRKEHATCPADE